MLLLLIALSIVITFPTIALRRGDSNKPSFTFRYRLSERERATTLAFAFAECPETGKVWGCLHQKRVYYRVTTPFTRKSLLAEALCIPRIIGSNH